MYLPLIFVLLIVGVSADKREVCKELVRLPPGLPNSFVDNLAAEYRKDDPDSKIIIRTWAKVEIILSCSLREIVPQPEPTIYQFFMVMFGFIIFWTIFVSIIYYNLSWVVFVALIIYIYFWGDQ